MTHEPDNLAPQPPTAYTPASKNPFRGFAGWMRNRFASKPKTTILVTAAAVLFIVGGIASVVNPPVEEPTDTADVVQQQIEEVQHADPNDQETIDATTEPETTTAAEPEPVTTTTAAPAPSWDLEVGNLGINVVGSHAGPDTHWFNVVVVLEVGTIDPSKSYSIERGTGFQIASDGGNTVERTWCPSCTEDMLNDNEPASVDSLSFAAGDNTPRTVKVFFEAPGGVRYNEFRFKSSSGWSWKGPVTLPQPVTTTTAPAPTTTAAPATTAEPDESLGESNARRTAADYLAYSAFSRSGLIDQLEFEGFTRAQAEYGVNAVGADWNEQAAASAAEYLAYSAFSRIELISQLEFEGFTRAQAEYGVNAVGY